MLQEEFDLPTDDLTTVRIAKVVNDWYNEEMRKTAEIVKQIGSKKLKIWAIKAE